MPELQPHDILLDVHNLPEFDRQQFEGRIQKPIRLQSLKALFGVMLAVSVLFVVRLFSLQIIHSSVYQKKSEQNRLNSTPLFADRGVIYDRGGIELAWNGLAIDDAATDTASDNIVRSSDENVTSREYVADPGFGNLLGYVSYPAKDSSGKLWQHRAIGKDGVEKEFDDTLAGKNGTKLIETSVSKQVTSQDTLESPEQGQNVTLSIDADVQKALYGGIKALAEKSGYVGGAGAVMDIKTGELLAITTYPEYSAKVMTEAKDTALINQYLKSKSRPFLNRAIDGVYTPGSIVKPFFALAALHERVIDPNKVIHTTGELRIPNPYSPGQFSVFKDNANHGDVDMRKAIAVSANVYFYYIGGGVPGHPGLGIANLEKYSRLFGLGQKTGINLSGELQGSVPGIAWKAKNFPHDPWRIGDTYHSAIGQYGYQVTPLQMLRAVASIASNGLLVTPTILKRADGLPAAATKLPFTADEFSVIHDAMRMTVTSGTASILNVPQVQVAAKTGTAQINNNTKVNSWAEGFFPLDNPRYAFIVLMENGPKVSTGATHAMRPVIDLFVAHPELLSGQPIRDRSSLNKGGNDNGNNADTGTSAGAATTTAATTGAPETLQD